MGRSVESYRIAMEEEIHRWDGFARAPRKDDREAFDELMGMSSCFAMASSSAANPVIFEPMIMSMLLARQERIRNLKELFFCDTRTSHRKPSQQLTEALSKIQSEVMKHG